MWRIVTEIVPGVIVLLLLGELGYLALVHMALRDALNELREINERQRAVLRLED